MKTTYIIIGLMLWTLPVLSQKADVLVDFEDKAEGNAIPVFSLEGSSAARAVVASDPLNAKNKVVHVMTSADATAGSTEESCEDRGEPLQGTRV